MRLEDIGRKEPPTGADLGRYEIALTIKEFTELTTGQKLFPGLSREALEDMFYSLSADQREIYEGYQAIHRWMSDKSQSANAMGQQLLFRGSQLFQMVSDAVIAEKIQKYVYSLPRIVTEQNYENRKEQRIKMLGEYTAPTISLFDIMGAALAYYAKLLETNPRKRNPLKLIKKEMEKTPVTNEYILERYSFAIGAGYFLMEDGTRSDKVSWNDWLHCLCPNPPHGANVEKIADALKNQERPSWEKLLKHGMGENEAITILSIDNDMGGIFEIPDWVPTVKTADNLNVWELISSGCLPRIFEAMAGNGSNEEKTRDIEAFSSLPGVLVYNILMDMDKKGIKGAKNAKKDTWLRPIYTMKEAYRNDFYDFRNQYAGASALYDLDDRAQRNGVAVINTDFEYSRETIDNQGNYHMPSISYLADELSIMGFSPDAKTGGTKSMLADAFLSLVTGSLRWISGYNTALDLIAEVYNLPEIRQMKGNIGTFTETVTRYNRMRLILDSWIRQGTYPEPQGKTVRIRLLDHVFPLVDIPKETAIPEKKIAAVRSLFQSGFSAFTTNDNDPCYWLCYRGADEGGSAWEKLSKDIPTPQDQQ